MTASFDVLGPADADALRAFLTKDSAHNLYLLGLFEEFGVVPKPGRAPFSFYGGRVSGELVSAIFVGGTGGLVVPALGEPKDAAQLAESLMGKVQLRACMGDQDVVESVVRYLAQEKPRFQRVQRLFKVSADDLGPFTNPTLRLATEADLERVLPLAQSAIVELHARDPLAEDPVGFRARVLQRIRGKRTYVLELEGTIVFKIDIGSRSQFGAELEGPYTVPHERRRGHATLSLGQISRHLLSSLPRLTLRVDEADPSMAHVARKVGFVPGRLQKLVVME